MKIKVLLSVFAFLLLSGTTFAQEAAMGNIRLFQSFFEDAHVTPSPYIDGEFDYKHYDDPDYDFYRLGARFGYPINPKTELHGRIGALYLDPDNGSESGISDTYLGGRYLLADGKTKVTAGGFLTLPTGREKTREDNFDVGAYSALRHPVSNDFVLTGTVGIIYTEKPYEFDDDHKTVLRLGGGAIYQHADNLHFIGEAVVKSRYDYMLLTAGIDYALDRKSSLRGAFGVGLDDDAPDFRIMASYFFMF